MTSTLFNGEVVAALVFGPPMLMHGGNPKMCGFPIGSHFSRPKYGCPFLPPPHPPPPHQKERRRTTQNKNSSHFHPGRHGTQRDVHLSRSDLRIHPNGSSMGRRFPVAGNCSHFEWPEVLPPAAGFESSRSRLGGVTLAPDLLIWGCSPPPSEGSPPKPATHISRPGWINRVNIKKQGTPSACILKTSLSSQSR